MRFSRGIVTALVVSVGAGCQGRDQSPRTDPGVARDQVPPAAATASPASAPSVAWRVIGTEPFWGLDIDSTGLRFTTPEDATGIRWPTVAPMVRGDTSRWVARTERAGLDARIWAARCSDGMSDRVWPATAVVRVGDTSYRGCAESRAPSTATSAVEGNWRVVAHRAPEIAALSPREADAWVGRKARFSASVAEFGAEVCMAPSYLEKRLTAEVFSRDFRVLPAELGLPVPIQMVEIRCAVPWNGPGSRLFVKGPGVLLTAWDGVFFELRRE